MKILSNEQLENISLRNSYQKALGKEVRLNKWMDLKLEIEAAFGDEPITKQIIIAIASYKKLSPKWRVVYEDILKIKKFTDEIPDNGLDGATMHVKVRQLCKYDVSDRTLKEWFHDCASTYNLRKIYTRQQCINIGIKAMTSNPRAYSKKK